MILITFLIFFGLFISMAVAVCRMTENHEIKSRRQYFDSLYKESKKKKAGPLDADER